MIFNHHFKKGAPHAGGFNNTDAYLFLGDSMMTGGVDVEPGDWPAEYATADYSRTLILYKDDRTNETATIRFLPYSVRVEKNRFPGYGVVGPVTPAPPYAVGIDNSFMYYMSQNAKKPVALCKWALGGTSLQVRTGTPPTDWDVSSDEMYRSGMDYYQRYSQARLKTYFGYPGSGVRYKACVVMLGTNDTETSVWIESAFIAAIPNFIAGIRSYTGMPDLPIYWIQIRADLGSESGGTHLQANVDAARTALINCQAGGSTEITGFHLMDYESVTTTVDEIHLTANSNKLIGLDLAPTFLAL